MNVGTRNVQKENSKNLLKEVIKDMVSQLQVEQEYPAFLLVFPFWNSELSSPWKFGGKGVDLRLLRRSHLEHGDDYSIKAILGTSFFDCHKP